MKIFLFKIFKVKAKEKMIIKKNENQVQNEVLLDLGSAFELIIEICIEIEVREVGKNIVD